MFNPFPTTFNHEGSSPPPITLPNTPAFIYVKPPQQEDDVWELVLATLLIVGIVGLLTHKFNLTYFQRKRPPEMPPILEGIPDSKLIFIFTIVIFFVLLVVPPFIFKH